MNKAGLFFHNMRHFIKNKNNAHIMVNDSHPPIPQVEENNKQYTVHDVKRDDWSIKLQNITGQPINRILHASDKNILQNIPILQEDVVMDEDIYGPSVPHLQGKQSATNYSIWNL